MAFDTAILAALRSDMEVRIHTGKKAGRGVIIWVVVVDDTVYVRSVRGPTGKWFVAAKAAGRAEVEVGQHRAPVRVTSVDDARTIDAVSQAYLRKYASSPYAKSMVAPETLPTTLRLDPVSLRGA
jgi:hypothetical protein